MKKYLIYSDVHFSTYSSILRSRGRKYSTRLHNLIDSVSWAEHLADEKDCDAVINLGDFFDRPDIESEVITALQDVYFCNKPHIIVTGNHDANISNLELLRNEMKNFRVNILHREDGNIHVLRHMAPKMNTLIIVFFGF